MTQTLQARNVTLRDLIDQFGLQEAEDDFFWEWRSNLPDLSESDKHFLDNAKAAYFNHLKYPPLLEKVVQIILLSPLLFVGGFFLPPFHIQAEKSVEIAREDDGVIIRGQLDLVLLKNDLWVVVIESKQAEFSVEAGLAQLLAYMLASASTDKPVFGLVIAGGSFLFTKLVRFPAPQYAASDEFKLRNRSENELYEVLRILKRLAQL
jgi:hypothetical protein